MWLTGLYSKQKGRQAEDIIIIKILQYISVYVMRHRA